MIVDRQRRDHHDDRLPRDSRSRGSYRMEGRLNERSPGARRRSPPYSRSQYQEDRRLRDRSPYMDRRPVKRERRDEFDHKQVSQYISCKKLARSSSSLSEDLPKVFLSPQCTQICKSASQRNSLIKHKS